jgi:hypothetical protein
MKEDRDLILELLRQERYQADRLLSGTYAWRKGERADLLVRFARLNAEIARRVPQRMYRAGGLYVLNPAAGVWRLVGHNNTKEG